MEILSTFLYFFSVSDMDSLVLTRNGFSCPEQQEMGSLVQSNKKMGSLVQSIKKWVLLSRASKKMGSLVQSIKKWVLLSRAARNGFACPEQQENGFSCPEQQEMGSLVQSSKSEY